MEYDWNSASNHISSAYIISIGSRWKTNEKRNVCTYIHSKRPKWKFRKKILEDGLFASEYERKTTALFVRFRIFRSKFVSSASGCRNGCKSKRCTLQPSCDIVIVLHSFFFCTHLMVLCVFLSFDLVNDVLCQELNAFHSVCTLHSSQCFHFSLCLFRFYRRDLLFVLFELNRRARASECA